MFYSIARFLQALSLMPSETMSDNHQFYAWVTKGLGDAMLALSVVGLVISILIAYPYYEFFSMGAQLSAHLGVLLFATVLKIGYVMRLIGHYELDLKMT
jgi:phosphoglycerol transferase MdoB-like AlkP superfamily enzyme